MSSGASLQPTFNGHVATTQDALLLFEACLQGHLSHVPRRPHDRERNALIRSGSVFIYEENASGIKRWTDGVLWSPSRILGNFLVYRELDKPFPPGQKKKAFQKNKRRPSRPGEPYGRPGESGEGYSPVGSQSSSYAGEPSVPEAERSLIGSLIDSYEFKPDGLVKKTMSVTVSGVTHHLVSYYNVSDVLANNLRTPSQTDTLQYIRPRVELTSKQSFRAPIEEGDDMESMRTGQQPGYPYRMSGPGYMSNQHYMQPPYGYMAQPPTTGGYPVAPMGPPYLQTQLPPTQMPPRSNEYSQYHQSPYSRSYEALNHPQATPSSATPTQGGMHDQARQSPYSSSNIPQSQMPSMSSMPMDSRAAPQYGRTSYGMPTEPAPEGRAQNESAPPHDPRDPHSAQTPSYSDQRPPYYPQSSDQQAAQRQYPQNPQMPHWSGQPPNQ